MPNRVHRTPRLKNHHQIADRSRTPARMVSRSVPEGVASLVIATSVAARGRFRVPSSFHEPMAAKPVNRADLRPAVGSARALLQPAHEYGVAASVPGQVPAPAVSASARAKVASRTAYSASSTAEIANEIT